MSQTGTTVRPLPPDRSSDGPPDGGTPATTRGRARRRKRHERLRSRRTWFGRHPVSTLMLAAVIFLSPIWWSFGTTVANSGNGSPPAAAAEWVRSHGGGGLVSWVENVWYSHHQPPVGGHPSAGAIPPPSGVRHLTAPSAAHLPLPTPIAPLATPPIVGEGQWHPVGRLVHGIPAVYEAFLRPDPVHTSEVVGVAWMDTSLLAARLYSGSSIPGFGPWHSTAPVSPTAAQRLVAAFNAGFRMQDARGGYYSEVRLVAPLRTGAASIVVYSDGRATVARWGRDATMTPDVVAVRQNLDLLVDNGAPVPGLSANDTTSWGATLGNHVYVWRSGLGVTAAGALVYVGGPGLNVTTLADLLVRAGAVRAMALDMNTDWVNYSTYAGADGQATTPSAGDTLLPAMPGGPGRYFNPAWSRDFLTMSARP